MKKCIALLGLCLLLSGCSSFKETHYFKDSLLPISNYYKVEVRGYSFLSSSRYVSGYYDRNAIQDYFGELSQPTNGSFKNITPLATNDPNKELVLLLSSNSDAIAQAFGNFVKSKNSMNSLAVLLNQKQIENYRRNDKRFQQLKNSIDLYKNRIDFKINTVTDRTDAEVRAIYTELVRSELQKLYPNETIPTTLPQIKTWLNAKN